MHGPCIPLGPSQNCTNVQDRKDAVEAVPLSGRAVPTVPLLWMHGIAPKRAEAQTRLGGHAVQSRSYRTGTALHTHQGCGLTRSSWAAAGVRHLDAAGARGGARPRFVLVVRGRLACTASPGKSRSPGRLGSVSCVSLSVSPPQSTGTAGDGTCPDYPSCARALSKRDSSIKHG